MAPPFLSIVIPTKDRPHILANCLSHLHRCRFAFDFEVVIVDGSADTATQLMVQTHPLKDKITYLGEPSTFAYYPFNRNLLSPVATIIGALYARGKYFCYLGDDDYIVVPRLNALMEHLARAPRGAVIPRFDAWDDIKKEVILTLFQLPSQGTTFLPNDGRNLFVKILQHGIFPEYFIYNTDLFRNVGFMFPNLYVHFVWLLLMAKQSTVELYNEAVFLQTRISPLYDASYTNAASQAYAKNMKHTLPASISFGGALLLGEAMLEMRKKESMMAGLVGKYRTPSFINFAVSQHQQGNYLESYIVLSETLCSLPQNKIKPLLHQYIEPFLTGNGFEGLILQLICQRFDLLVKTQRAAFFGFYMGHPLIEVYACSPPFPANIFQDLTAENATLKESTFFVAATKEHQRTLISAGVPGAHILDYSALREMFFMELPFVQKKKAS